MSTHKNIGVICLIAAVVALAITAALMLAARSADADRGTAMGYEDLLFDDSYVHAIDIQMDDWGSFIDTCESEEYSACTVTIDGETIKLVGIRGKGNTSLSTVSSMDSDRYSFKLEFDQYESGSTYHGLDKLSLNNLIQDASCMKDYLAYKAMALFGVDAPLCSYAYITVNGEDWGLYLAVEGVEESYLERNHGADYGELYKPDSMDFGGGRGNGARFDMEGFTDEDSSAVPGAGEAPEGFGPNTTAKMEAPEGFDPSAMASGEMPEGFDPGAMAGGEISEGFDPSAMMGREPPEGFDLSAMMGGEMPAGREPGTMVEEEMPDGFDPNSIEDGAFDFAGPFGGMGSSDVKLQYIDGNASSYSNIFDNAKTSVTAEDKTRLIDSLEKLSAQEDIESVVDVDQVLRYFTVHNFVCNGDSYTGTMVHNYYLYEEDGRLSMIPWDYNLAYGTFSAGEATGAVNEPIDTPVSGGSTGDRPMFDWIVADEQYLELYHEYFAAFLEEVNLAAIAEETASMIAPYVEKDPTAFYSCEEFEQGVSAIVEFCELRAESVAGQLAGAIPSTTEGQAQDSSALIDASNLNLSDMGSMGDTGTGGGMGGMPGGMPSGDRPADDFEMPDGQAQGESDPASEKPSTGGDAMPEGFQDGSESEFRRPPEGFPEDAGAAKENPAPENSKPTASVS